MLFAIHATFTYRSEESQDRLNTLFNHWTPPEGVEIKEMYTYADDTGSLIISESESAGAMYEAMGAFKAYADFDVKPLITMDQVLEIADKTRAWRKSVAS